MQKSPYKMEDWQMWLSAGVFVTALIAIIFDYLDKTVVALVGGALLIICGILSFEEAVASVDFEIITLLAAMMIIVEIAQESGLFTLINFRMARYSKGNPFLIFLFFTLLTAAASAFLDNVTTILIVVPLTVALVQGMGYNPTPFIMAEILLSNIGGALTLVGDPPNVLVGTAVGLSFNSFIVHLWIPISLIIVLTLLAFYIVRWNELKPIHHHLPKLFISHLLFQKIQYQYLRTHLNAGYMKTVTAILGLTVLGFLLQFIVGLPIAVIALTGALVLMLAVHRKISVEHVFAHIEWTTLGFFAGLFVMVAGLESTGLLDIIAHWLVTQTDSFSLMILLIVWTSGIVSMLINNIPFVTLMIPIISNVQATMPDNPHSQILWWALILGSALGGNATIIGASANLIGVEIARKSGVNITFLAYLKYCLPLTIGALIISSAYLLIWNNYF